MFFADFSSSNGNGILSSLAAAAVMVTGASSETTRIEPTSPKTTSGVLRQALKQKADMR
jgi:hypothetical protein